MLQVCDSTFELSEIWLMIFSCSALVALHDSQPSRSDWEYLQFTVDLLKPVMDTMTVDSDIFLSGKLVSIEDASPILIRWAYDAGIILSRLVSLYESSDLEHLRRMVGKLEIMSQRWLAAGMLTANFHNELALTFCRCLS
jgi:hypothetical protein